MINNWFELLGFLVLLISLGFVALMLTVDCDIITFLYFLYGKPTEAELKGKVVWVTGASSGIGKAIAKELANVGARIVLSARRKEELESVKQECLRNNSQLKDHDILVLPFDVTIYDVHTLCLKNVLKHFGKLDILINNAGQTQQGECVNMDIAVDKHIFDINVFSVINMTRVVVKYFLENGGGLVVVVSSLSGRHPLPFSSAYSASKHALHGYFNSLRMETYRKNIDVTIICPGPVDTPIFTKVVMQKSGELGKTKLPEGFTFMSPERCAYLCLISIANRLHESWLSKFPFIPIGYLQLYCPLLSDIFFRTFGWKKVEEIRKYLATEKTQ
ncbi:unnamed protein product [Allacma fusca]|uniref:Dehydrogenase/reductase SDR family member 7 n=1 Tax=Allacma fusca TaxID=39272 RepID=A0A8J2LH71_9HEXA|nr:unnamed protein product [Allacma fusca]